MRQHSTGVGKGRVGGSERGAGGGGAECAWQRCTGCNHSVSFLHVPVQLLQQLLDMGSRCLLDELLNFGLVQADFVLVDEGKRGG